MYLDWAPNLSGHHVDHMYHLASTRLFAERSQADSAAQGMARRGALVPFGSFWVMQVPHIVVHGSRLYEDSHGFGSGWGPCGA